MRFKVSRVKSDGSREPLATIDAKDEREAVHKASEGSRRVLKDAMERLSPRHLRAEPVAAEKSS